MISCMFSKHSPDRINVLLLRVLCLKCLLFCIVSCNPVIKGPRQQYMEEHTASREAQPIMPPISQGHGITGQGRDYTENTQRRNPSIFNRENADRYRIHSSVDSKRNIGRQQDQSHDIPGEFNVIRPEIHHFQNERADSSFSDRIREETSVLYSVDSMDKLLEQEDLMRWQNERRGRIKYSGHESILVDSTSKSDSKPLKVHSIPLAVFTEKMSQVNTFHDILRIFYCQNGQTCSDELLEHTFLIQTHQYPNTQMMIETKAKEPHRIPLARHPKQPSDLEQGTQDSKMMQDSPMSDKTSHISFSRSFKSNLDIWKYPNNKNKKTPTNNSKNRKRRHNKRKKNRRRKKKSKKGAPKKEPPKKNPIEEYESALKHANDMKALDCRVPTPEIIHIADHEISASKVYYPHCTTLYRCRRSSGCCKMGDEVCGPKTIETVTLPFIVFPLENDSVQVLNSTERMVFENHTECECQSKKSINSKCRCPWPFMRDPDDMSACRCICVDGKSPAKCKKIYYGHKYIVNDDYKCLQNGTCTKPECPKTSMFDLQKGRCLKKREFQELQSREAENDKTPDRPEERHRHDNKNHHQNHKGERHSNNNHGNQNNKGGRQHNNQDHHSKGNKHNNNSNNQQDHHSKGGSKHNNDSNNQQDHHSKGGRSNSKHNNNDSNNQHSHQNKTGGSHYNRNDHNGQHNEDDRRLIEDADYQHNKGDMDDNDDRSKHNSDRHHIGKVHESVHHHRNENRHEKPGNTSANVHQSGSGNLQSVSKRKNDCVITNVSDSELPIVVQKRNQSNPAAGDSILHGKAKNNTDVIVHRNTSSVQEIDSKNNINVSFKNDSNNNAAINGSDNLQNILNGSDVGDNLVLHSSTAQPYVNVSDLPNVKMSNISDEYSNRNGSTKVLGENLHDEETFNNTGRNITSKEVKFEQYFNGSEEKTLNIENVNNSKINMNNNNGTVNDHNHPEIWENKTGQIVKMIYEKNSTLNDSHSNTNISQIIKEKDKHHTVNNETISSINKTSTKKSQHLTTTSDNELSTTEKPLELNTNVRYQDELVTSGSGASETPDPK